MFIGSAGPQSDAADHRRVSSAGRDARRAEHQRADRRDAEASRSSSLESDAQPPKTQSELLSLLAFGQIDDVARSRSSSSSVARIGGDDAICSAPARRSRCSVSRASRVGVVVDQVEVQAGRAFGTDVFDITPATCRLERRQTALANFLTQTKIEAGKYINGRDVRERQEQARSARVSAIEHRTADGWRFNASVEPRHAAAASRRCSTQTQS